MNRTDRVSAEVTINVTLSIIDQVRRLCVLNSLPDGEREHDAEKTVGASFNFWALSGYYGLITWSDANSGQKTY